MATTDANRYHHGALHDALLDAALAMLEREGPAALSLRALARAVGVSPMAPYHHFKDREALLAAVATAGFERLQQSKLANEAAHHDVRVAISEGAANYVRFILDNPNLYRLMKGPEFADRDRYPALHAAAAAPAATLLRLIESLFGDGALPQGVAQRHAQTLWALAHGIGTLALDGQLPQETAPRLAREGAAAIIAGWLGAAVQATPRS